MIHVKTLNLQIISNIHIYVFLHRIKDKENLNKHTCTMSNGIKKPRV